MASSRVAFIRDRFLGRASHRAVSRETGKTGPRLTLQPGGYGHRHEHVVAEFDNDGVAWPSQQRLLCARQRPGAWGWSRARPCAQKASSFARGTVGLVTWCVRPDIAAGASSLVDPLVKSSGMADVSRTTEQESLGRYLVVRRCSGGLCLRTLTYRAGRAPTKVHCRRRATPVRIRQVL